MQRVPLFKPWKVAAPGTLIDTSEDLSDHDEGNKAFDKDVEEGDEAEARNMNDGFIANSSNEQELTENESTTLRYETLDTLYFIASLWMRKNLWLKHKWFWKRYFCKLWVFIYLKWWSDRPHSASFRVKATFPFYSTERISWNHHSPLISITESKRESGFYPEWGWLWSIRSSPQIDEHSQFV